MRKPETRNPKLETRFAPVPQRIAPRLLTWFAANARDLPWRRTRDPYAIWVSEIMLQQTQVKTVIPYWERWMRELPTIQSLAKAKPQKLHKLWEGLGYYTRVRNMQKAAQQVCVQHGSKFPKQFEDIFALPGIGRYTAGAIASIAFNQPAPILDGNVIRVLTRLHGIGDDPQEKETNARLWQLAEELVSRAGRLQSRTRTRDEDDFACSRLNQSLMELGAVICTPRSPNCAACPVARHCVAFREGRVGELPRPKQRTAVTARRFVAFVVERQSRFLVRQRGAGVVNAHLWEFPNWEGDARSSASGLARKHLGTNAGRLEEFCQVKHSITRYRITTEAYRLHLEERNEDWANLPGVWRTQAQLRKLPFTSAHRRIERHLEKVLPAT